MWILYAFGSALFAGATAILAKIGIKQTDSHVATAIRTVVIVLFSWLMVFVVGAQHTFDQITSKTLIFLILSGLSTGASWLFYFRALQLGDVNKVVPIDKSSTILTMILAFIFLHEAMTWIRFSGMLAIGIGTYMMIQKSSKSEKKVKPINCDITHDNSEKKDLADTPKVTSKAWLIYALLSAFFASITSILGKIGVQDINSTLGTAIRTIIVLIMAWLIVFMLSKQKQLMTIDKTSWIFLILSGLTTGLSWLCYYKALKDGLASVVVPIDKLSIVVSVAFAYLFLKEKLTLKSSVGLGAVIVGTLVLLIK